ncbi:hypothetical protein PRNP1_008854 [Phytophthora ramorum]
MALKHKSEHNCPFIVGIDLSGNSERPGSEFYRFEHVLARYESLSKTRDSHMWTSAVPPLDICSEMRPDLRCGTKIDNKVGAVATVHVLLAVGAVAAMRVLLAVAVFVLAGAAANASAIDMINATDAVALVALYAVPECTIDQLNLGEAILTTEPDTLLCEHSFGIQPGMLLQSADVADALCEKQSCLNALRILYATLPNCRYERWGLRSSAGKFLHHCGFATNDTSIA